MSGEPGVFVAGASHPSLGEAGVGGNIVFEQWRLRFVSTVAVLELPLARLQITFETDGDRRVCFRDPQLPDWTVFTYDLGILEQAALRQQSHTRNQIRALQSVSDLKRRLKLTCYCLAGFAGLALGCSLLLGLMVRSLVARVPAQWEQQQGNAAMQDLKQEMLFVEDPKLMAKLTNAVNPLLAGLPKTPVPFSFYLVAEPLPNAFALPGGHVVVSTGLLALTDRPEEIAGTVAHEIAHVNLKHAFRQAISAAGPYLIFKIFARNGGGLVGLLGNGSQLLVRQSFSQEYELEADALGWQYLVDAHIDPRGLAGILKKLDAEYGRLHLKGLPFEEGAFSSHPATAKRLQRLEVKWKKLRNKAEFERRSVGASERRSVEA